MPIRNTLYLYANEDIIKYWFMLQRAYGLRTRSYHQLKYCCWPIVLPINSHTDSCAMFDGWSSINWLPKRNLEEPNWLAHLWTFMVPGLWESRCRPLSKNYYRTLKQFITLWLFCGLNWLLCVCVLIIACAANLWGKDTVPVSVAYRHNLYIHSILYV